MNSFIGKAMIGPRENGFHIAGGSRRLLQNIGWLLGGKGFAAVASLVYLAILSRSLGLKDFGHFSLIFGTAQALVAIVSLNTWKTIVRFGAEPVHQGRWERLGRLTWLCAAADLGGVLVGCLLAAIIFFGFDEMLSLNPRYVEIGFYFTCALLLARTSTAAGVVRILDRFDVGTIVEAIVPTGRLVLAGLILTTGATVEKFLVAWAIVDLVSAAVYWFAAWKLAPQSLHHSHMGRWRDTLSENEGVREFLVMTFMSSTLEAIFKQGPLLAVGFFLSTSAAGLYRLADQLSQGIGRFAQIVTRAVFPELAIANATAGGEGSGKLVRKVSLAAALGGILVTLLTIAFGQQIFLAIGGAQFARGAPILLPLVIGASLELAAVSFEPMLLAVGRARISVVVRAVALCVMAITAYVLLPLGPIGVGWGVVAGMAVNYLLMAYASSRVLAEVRSRAIR